MTHSDRLTLWIDVFEQPRQQALVLPHLTPPQLIEAILREFARDLAYLSEQPADYQLRAQGKPLRDDQPLSEQVSNETSLVLHERSGPVPSGTVAAPDAIYLLEQRTGQLSKLRWLPAIIGRSGGSLPNDIPLALDLGPYPNGLRVSRRHAEIRAAAGAYQIVSLARHNPIVLIRSDQPPLTLDGQPHPLRHDDQIRLPNSELIFRFMVRATPAKED
ncbi:MAG: FHA domain-containing protein [Oscillochloridaceae bacterium umkhey_bin13]